ncbi:MAG: ferredoxin [Chitinivibrionales bacterium]
MKAAVNHFLCQGCGMCISIRPSIFEKNAFGKARIKVSSIPPDEYNRCLLLARLCPARAIAFGDSPQMATITVRRVDAKKTVSATAE